MDEFLKQLLASQERIAAALEKIAAKETVTVGEVSVTATPEAAAAVKEAAKPATKPVEKKAEAPKEEPKPEPEPEPEAPAEPEGPTYTIDEVRAALKEYRAIEGAPAMLEVLKTHGGKEALTEVDPSAFPAIMEAVGAAK